MPSLFSKDWLGPWGIGPRPLSSKVFGFVRLGTGGEDRTRARTTKSRGIMALQPRRIQLLTDFGTAIPLLLCNANQSSEPPANQSPAAHQCAPFNFVS